MIHSMVKSNIFNSRGKLPKQFDSFITSQEQLPKEMSYRQMQNAFSSSNGVGTTQSSYYKNSPQKQSKVRIRGKNNQILEMEGDIRRTLDQDRILKEKRRQIQRSNERLRML